MKLYQIRNKQGLRIRVAGGKVYQVRNLFQVGAHLILEVEQPGGMARVAYLASTSIEIL